MDYVQNILSQILFFEYRCICELIFGYFFEFIKNIKPKNFLYCGEGSKSIFFRTDSEIIIYDIKTKKFDKEGYHTNYPVIYHPYSVDKIVSNEIETCVLYKHNNIKKSLLTEYNIIMYKFTFKTQKKKIKDIFLKDELLHVIYQKKIFENDFIETYNVENGKLLNISVKSDNICMSYRIIDNRVLSFNVNNKTYLFRLDTSVHKIKAFTRIANTIYLIFDEFIYELQM